MHVLATEGRESAVRFVALDKQHAHIEEELMEAFARLLRTSAYTLGSEVQWFEAEFADYCETDVVNTYRVWLRYELFRGRLMDTEFQGSESNLVEFIRAHGNTKPHLAGLT